MITPFIYILVGLNIGVPVRCYGNEVEWKAQKAEVQALSNAVAYYHTGEDYIALGPFACKEVRRPTMYGAYVLVHELTHVRQDKNGTAFSEDEADDNARRFSPGWLHKLEKFYKRKAQSPVTLAP